MKTPTELKLLLPCLLCWAWLAAPFTAAAQDGGPPPGWDGEGPPEGWDGEGPPPGYKGEGPPPGWDGGSAAGPGRMPSYKKSVASGEKYIAQKKYSSALREFTKALVPIQGDDQRKVYVYERLGWLSLKVGDMDGALGYYLTATSQAEKLETYDKYAVNAYRGAAYCYERGGEPGPAVENYRRALQLTTNRAARQDIEKKLKKLAGTAPPARPRPGR